MSTAWSSSPQLTGRVVVPPGAIAQLEATGADFEVDVSGYHLMASGGRGGVYSVGLFEGTIPAGGGLVTIVGDPAPDTVVIRDLLANAGAGSSPELSLYIQPAAGGGSGLPCWSTTPAGGGSSVPGALVTHKAPFAFDTPGLLTGATAVFDDGYVPAVGDLVHDAWLRPLTPWDGTTPLGDLGSFVGNNVGWLQDLVAAVDMSQADDNSTWGDGSLSSQSHLGLGGPSGLQAALMGWMAAGSTARVRAVPAAFVVAHPVKVVVSQDGTNTGADPGSTHGTAMLYLVTSHP